MDRLFTTAEAARLIGINYRTIDLWITAGLLVLARQGRGRGKGRERMLDGRGIIAAGIIKTLRQQGAPFAMLRPIGVWIGNTSTEVMESAFAEGRTVLVSVGGSIPPRLAPLTGAVVNRTGSMTMAVVIDLEKAYRRVAHAIEQLGPPPAQNDVSPTAAAVAGEPIHAT